MKMTNEQMMILLSSILGPLDCGWELSSGHDRCGAFTIIRYEKGFRMGELRKTHSLIEDLLSEHVGDGERVTDLRSEEDDSPGRRE